MAGNYDQTSTGVLALDLGGGANPVAGTDYDQLILEESCNKLILAGGLALTALPTLTATPGTVFGLIDNKSSLDIVGEFDGIPYDPDGTLVTVGGWTFLLRYNGQIDPNDLYFNDVTLELLTTNGNTGSVSGTVWDDANGDGVKDAGEALAAGVPVDVVNVATGHAVRVVTNSSGAYAATGLEEGDYRVRFDKAASPTYAGRRFTTTNADSDANPLTGVAGPYFVDTGAAVTNVDAGLVDNAAPVGTTTALGTERGDTLNATIEGTDAESDSFTIEIVDEPQNGTLTLGANGALTYVPNSGFVGVDWFSYRLSDLYGPGELVWVEVNVASHAPTATNDTATTNEDTPVTLSVLSNDTDPDGDTLAVLEATDGENGTTVVNADGTITYTPFPNWNGTDQFSYLIDDGYGRLAIATATVTVNPVNDAPTIDYLPAVVAQKNTPIDIDLRARVSDIETPLTNLTFAVSNAYQGTVELLGDGYTARFTPNADYYGGAFFNVEATDDGDGTASPVTASGSVNLSVNAPPTVAAGLWVHLAPGQTVSFYAYFSDPDGDPWVMDEYTQPEHGTVSPDSLGYTFNYTAPLTPFVGTTTFTITLSDDRGGTTTETVTVELQNQAPVGSDVALEWQGGGPISIYPTYYDPDGDPLTVTTIEQPAVGSVAPDASGWGVVFLPPSGFTGVATFNYTVDDGHGGTDTIHVTVTVV